MSGSQDQMRTEVVRKRGRPRKNPIAPASPVSSITSSSTDAKSPVYNIHIHLHSPSGVNSNLLSKIQPIVHLHLDKGTHNSSPNVTPPPATRRRSYRKRASSPSLSLISTKKKRKGKNDSCCGSEDSETSLNGFNPIYMSTQRKDSGDDLARCENAFDKNNVAVDEMCNPGELIDSYNEVPETNLPVDKSSRTCKTPRKKQNRDVQSDSSTSLVSHKCLRYIMPTTTGRADGDPSSGKSICAKSRDENAFKLKQAVVQLRDLCRSKNIMNNLSEGRVTNVSSLMLKDMALRRNPKRTCVRNGSGEKVQWSSESESAGTKPRRSSRIRAPKSVSDEDKVNGNGLVIDSGDDEMSNNSDSETNSQTSIPDRVNGTGKMENTERTRTSLNTSRKNGNMYSMVYTPEKNTPKKRVVLGKKAVAVIDKLNFSEIKTRLRARERRDVTMVSCVDSSSIATDSEERLSPAELTSCDENSEAKWDDVAQDGTETVNGQIDRSSEQIIEKETDSLVETVTKDTILNVGSPVNDPVSSPNKSNSKSVEGSQNKGREIVSDSEVDKSSVILGSVNNQSRKDLPSKASVNAEDSSESEKAESDKSDSESDGESSLSEEEKRKNAKIGRSHFFSPEIFDKAAGEIVPVKKMTEKVCDEPDEEEDAGSVESESNSEKAEPLSQERSRISEQVEKEVHPDDTEEGAEASVEDSEGEEHGIEKAEENVENTKRDPAVTPVKKITNIDVPKCVSSKNGMDSSDSDKQFKVNRKTRRKKRKESLEKSRASEDELSSEPDEGSENGKSDESAMSIGIRAEPEKRNSKERDKSPDKQVSNDEEGSEKGSRPSVEKVMSPSKDNNEEIVGKDKDSVLTVNELSTPEKDQGPFGNEMSTSEVNGSSSEDDVVQEIDDFNDIDEAMVSSVKDKARRRAADETSSEDEEEKENRTEEDDKGECNNKCEEVVESDASEDSDVIGCSQKKFINNKKKVSDEVLEEGECDDEEQIGIPTKICNGQSKGKTHSESERSRKKENRRKGLKSRKRIEDNRKSEDSENEDDVSVDKMNAWENESESSKKTGVPSKDDCNGGLSEEEGSQENHNEGKECDKERLNGNVNGVEALTVKDKEEEVEHQEKCRVTNDREEEDENKTGKSEESSEKREVRVPDSKDHREMDEKENEPSNGKKVVESKDASGCNEFLDSEDGNEEGEMDQEITKIIEFLNKAEDAVKNKKPKNVRDDGDDVESTLASDDKDLACSDDDVNSDDVSDFKSVKSSKGSKGKKKKKKDQMESLVKKDKSSDDEKVEKCKRDKKEKKKKKRKDRHRDDRSGCEEEKTNLIDSSGDFERPEEITKEESKKERNVIDDDGDDDGVGGEGEKILEPEVVEGLMTQQRTCDSSDNESSCHSGEGRLVIALESDKESVVNNDNDDNDFDDVDGDDEAHKGKKKHKKKKRKKEKRRENADLSGGKCVCEPSMGAVADEEIQRSLDKSLQEFQSDSTSDKDKEHIPDGEEVKMGLKVKNKAKSMAKVNKSPIKRKEPPSKSHASPVPVKKAKKKEGKTKEGSEPKKPERKTAMKKYFDEEDYIPLNVAGPTKFALAQADKLKSYEKHDATTFRERMLFGDRVKRFASEKTYEIYKMKQEAAKRCSS